MKLISKFLIFISICKITHALISALDPSIDPITPPNYSSYLRGPVCTPSEHMRTPKNTAEVQSIVQEAISGGKTVKAVGHRHSTTDIICTDGIPIDMREIKGIKLNDDLTATVGAGVYMHDLTEFLRQNGRALKTTPAYGNITVGGAIGTGAHGSTIKFNSSISSQVVGLTIIDGLGNIQTITTEEDLHAFRVHLGLLGIILDIKLHTEPLYKVRAHNYVASDQILTNGGIIDIAKNTDQLTVYWFPSFEKVVVANWTIVDVDTPGNAVTNDHVPPTSETFNAYVTPFVEILQLLKSTAGLEFLQAYTMQTLLTTIPDFVPIYTENGKTVENPAVGYYDVMFAPICYDSGFVQCAWNHGPNNNLTFLDNEITIPLDRLPDFARTLQDIVSKSPAVFPNTGIVLRFSASSITYMSTSQGVDSCHFEFYMMKRKNPYEDPSLGLAGYQAILQSLAANYSGRSHWGKTGLHFHSAEMIEKKLNPHARAAFIAKMNHYDPNGVFMNAFGHRLKGHGNKINIDPATTHCALLDNCVCSTDSDCAAGQICTRISGYPDYPVCQDTELLSLSSLLDPHAYTYDTNLTIDKLMCSAPLGLDILTKLSCPLL